MIHRHLHRIAGRHVSPHSKQYMLSINPSTEEPIAEFARGDAIDVDMAVQAAAAAAPVWKDTKPSERGRLLHHLADLIESRRHELARLETLDVGKPISGSREDVDGVVATLHYNAGAADKMEGSVIPLGPDVVDFTMLEPLGVTAHITPWNFPLGMAARSIAPALAAGCTVVLKPAEESPLSTLVFADLAMEAGLPPGTVNVVSGTGAEAGAALVAHPFVRGITFTGSIEVGRQVAKAAAERICPVVLDLGGKNALIVWEDADLDRAVEDALVGGFENSGQVCSAASRLLVHSAVEDAFTEKLADRMARLRVAPGIDDGDLGPLVSDVQHEKVSTMVAEAVAVGGRVVSGGGRPNGYERGYFYAPTAISGLPSSARLLREDAFGPVVTITEIESEAEAVQIANDVGYGLVAGIQTRDISRAFRFAHALDTGSVWINGWYMGGVQAPTGGVKLSGIGRERGLPGIRNYLRIKNVAVRL